MLLWCVENWDTLLKVWAVLLSIKDEYINVYDLQYAFCTSTGAVAARFGAGIGPIYLDDVECNGSESSLTDCSHSFFVSCSSGHREDAGVRCQGRCK